MIDIIPYDSDLIESFVYDGIELQDNDNNICSVKEFASLSDACFIGMIDNVIVFVVGVFTSHKGVGCLWGYFNKALHKYPVTALKNVKKLYKNEIAKLPYHRVQCYCMVGLDNAHKLVEYLGFKREGLLKAYGINKEDFYIYSNVEEIEQ